MTAVKSHELVDEGNMRGGLLPGVKYAKHHFKHIYIYISIKIK